MLRVFDAYSDCGQQRDYSWSICIRNTIAVRAAAVSLLDGVRADLARRRKNGRVGYMPLLVRVGAARTQLLNRVEPAW